MTSTIKLRSSSSWGTTPSAWQLTNIWEAFVNTADEKMFISKWDWTYFEVEWTTTWSAPWQQVKASYIFWETIAVWDALRYAIDDSDEATISTVENDNITNMWDDASRAWVWQSFQMASWLNQVDSVRFEMRPTALMADKVEMILVDSDQSTILYTSDEQHTVTWSWTNYTFNFTNATGFSAATTYYAYIRRTWAINWTAYIELHNDTTNWYASGQLCRSQAWGASFDSFSADVYFLMEQSKQSTETLWRLYRTDASDENKINIEWFAAESGNAWESKLVNIWGYDDNQSWLTFNEEYFLTNTLWWIGSEPWDYTRLVGRWFNSTTINFDTLYSDQVYATDSRIMTLASASTWIDNTWVKLREIEIKKSWDYRVKWNVNWDTGSGTCYGRVYKNWVAHPDMPQINYNDTSSGTNFNQTGFFKKWDTLEIWGYDNWDTCTISALEIFWSDIEIPTIIL